MRCLEAAGAQLTNSNSEVAWGLGFLTDIRSFLARLLDQGFTTGGVNPQSLGAGTGRQIDV
jgi:hypothetical protein